MLTLVGTDAAENIVSLYFDPHTFKLYFDDTCTNMVPIANISTPVGRTVVIPLGYGCNNNCIYCTQKDMVDKPLNPWKLTDKVLEIQPHVEHIHFIGGEPLRQFSQLEHIVKLFPYCTYSIVTNGNNLTSDITEFIIKNKIYVTLSHDGQHHAISRGTDVLSSYKKRYIQEIASTGKLQVYSILFNHADSLFDRYIHFKSMDIPFDHIDIGTVIPFNKKLNNLIVSSNWDVYTENTLRDIAAVYAIDPSHMGGDYELVTNMHMLLHDKNTSYDRKYTKCPIFSKDTVTVNTAGEQIYCYNSKEIVTEQLTTSIRGAKDTEICKNCPVLMCCTSGCWIANPDQFSKICEVSFYKKMCYLHFFFKNTFGFNIDYIEGDFKYATNGRYTYPK